jgi:hypothetical protein
MTDTIEQPQQAIPVTPPRPGGSQPTGTPGHDKKKLFATIAILVFLVVVILLIMFFSRVPTGDEQLAITPTPTTQIQASISPTLAQSQSPTTPPINNEIVLIKDQPYELIDQGVAFTLTSSDIPTSTCRDCPSAATIVAKNAARSETLTFTCGGITGRCDTTKTAFGITIELINQIDSEKVIVTIDTSNVTRDISEQ